MNVPPGILDQTVMTMRGSRMLFPSQNLMRVQKRRRRTMIAGLGVSLIVPQEEEQEVM
jgi:hypothetical protein